MQNDVIISEDATGMVANTSGVTNGRSSSTSIDKIYVLLSFDLRL